MSLPLIGQITCPECATTTAEPVPDDACLYFFECPGCRTMLHPKPGDCCIFCSYGNMACPSSKAADEKRLGAGG
jgi:hypothetical protein